MQVNSRRQNERYPYFLLKINCSEIEKLLISYESYGYNIYSCLLTLRKAAVVPHDDYLTQQTHWCHIMKQRWTQTDSCAIKVDHGRLEKGLKHREEEHQRNDCIYSEDI